MKYRAEQDPDGTISFRTQKRGHDLLCDSLLNKGTAFTRDERRKFGLEGLLPPQVSDPEGQVARAFENIKRKNDALEKYIGLAAIQDRNETLFHQLLARFPETLVPIVYTPTVGEAALQFSHIFRRGRGLWITPEHRGKIYDVLGNTKSDDIRLIVVTDNERILGLGDQGVGGMVIPIGKLALYSMAAGIHPVHTLPISLDVGTDNEDLLADPLYVGWPHRRLRGEAYDEFVEEFVQAVIDRFPHALLQWEDFKKTTALRLLDRYRSRLPSFNDDIQGTGAVGLAGVLSSSRINGWKITDHRIVIAGAGAAGIGIARQVQHALAADGLQGDQLRRAIAMVDSQGLVTEMRSDLDAHKLPVAWTEADLGVTGLNSRSDLVGVVRAVRPTVLIGTTGQAGLFDQAVIDALATDIERPVVLPMSNPTSSCEAVPEQIISWTQGRALVATGSPAAPVTFRGKTHPISQGNNVLVFPGVGLGAIARRSTEVTDEMFTTAARTLAETLGDVELERGEIYPSISRLREVTYAIACAVAADALPDDASEETNRLRVDAASWDLSYPRLESRTT